MQEKIEFSLYKLIRPRSVDLFVIPGMKKKSPQRHFRLTALKMLHTSRNIQVL
jgi:hypothetical protein